MPPAAVSPALAEWVRPRFFAGGLTYSGHPLACASAVASIEAFQEEGIVENSAAMGAVVIALGVGFLVSAFLAYLLTRRFGLLNDAGPAPESRG